MKFDTSVMCLSPNFGGMEIDSLKLTKKLSKYKNIILIAKKDSFISENFNEFLKDTQNAKLEIVDFKNFFSLSLIKQVRGLIKKYKLKNLIFFGARELKSLHFALRGGGSSINLIVRHSRISNSNKKDIFYKFIYQNINYHVVLCKTMENNIREKTPFGKNTKIVMIYNDVKKFEFEKIKNDKLVLLHTGRIAPGKGQVDAMRACEILYKKDIDFIFYIVGGFQDKYKDEFMKIYKNLKYKDKIILTGFSKEVEKYLQISDIFLFPSHGEGLGNSFLEALSAGLKCISYDNTVFPEFKELGFDFAMVKNKDINALSKALLSVANKSAKFNVFKNKEIIKENFSNEAEKYLEILV